MQTIIKPQKHIYDLWSRPHVKDGEYLRQMKYVMRVDYKGRTFLHNNVTGQLIALNLEEAKIVDYLPSAYSSVLNQLIEGHFLVPIEYDEYYQVSKIREVLRKLDDAHRDNSITSYIILPTTACNARCYYCFEQGVETVTMSEQTADNVVSYITKNCGTDKKVNIEWFGGEPTVAADRIDRICKGLSENGVSYSSDMISNGYLFDEEMVARAKTIWNLKHVQISVDGVEEKYNKIKAFVYHDGSPYQRVMRNVGLLLESGIRVGLRMNFDLENHEDFYKLLDEAENRFKNKELLNVNAYPVIGEYPDKDGRIRHGSDAWFEDQYVRLNNKARSKGLYHIRRGVPFLKIIGCGADNKASATINAKGAIVRCPEQFDDTQITGNVIQGITDINMVNSWRNPSNYNKCRDCIFFPTCVKLKKCSASNHCLFQDRNHLYEDAVKTSIDNWLNNNYSYSEGRRILK